MTEQTNTQKRSAYGKYTVECEMNVGEGERLGSAIVGGALVMKGVARRTVPGLLLAGLGYALVRRGLSGYCPVYDALGVSSRCMGPEDEERAIRAQGFPLYSGGDETEPKDTVEEASMQSFPASDAPASTRTHV